MGGWDWAPDEQVEARWPQQSCSRSRAERFTSTVCGPDVTGRDPEPTPLRYPAERSLGPFLTMCPGHQVDLGVKFG